MLTRASSPFPRSFKEIIALDDEQRITLATILASGCAAGAYYAKDSNPHAPERFTLQSGYHLYPDEQYAFASELTEQQAEESKALGFGPNHTCTVPVVDRVTGEVKGIYMMKSTDEPGSFELLSQLKDKLGIADFIANYHQDFLAPTSHAQKLGRGSLKHLKEFMAQPTLRLAYYKALDERMMATMDDESRNMQMRHLKGVGMLTEMALDALCPDMDPTNKGIAVELARLHDIGKVQLSSMIFDDGYQAAAQGGAPDSAVNRYGLHRNHNHPVFSTLMLLFHEKDGLGAGLHHQSLLRYSRDDLERQKQKNGLSFSPEEITAIRDERLLPGQVPPLARLLRVCDVAESISGRTDKSMTATVSELYAKSRKMNEIGLPEINPEILVTLLERGVFERYAEARGKPLENPAAGESFAALKQQILSQEQQLAGASGKSMREERVHALLHADPVLYPVEPLKALPSPSFSRAAS